MPEGWLHRNCLQRDVDGTHLLRRAPGKVKAPKDHPRLPLSEIPADLICIDCKAPAFKVELAFRGHRWNHHRVLYEVRPRTQTTLQIEKNIPEPTERTTLEPWHAVAIAQHTLFGKPWSQIADEMRGGRGADTMRAVSLSPAGTALEQKISEIVGDPVALVKLLMQEHMLQAFADHLACREWARDAKDYKALHAMTKDIDLLPVLESMKKPTAMGPTTLVVQLSGGGLETAKVTTDYTVVEADVEEG